METEFEIKIERLIWLVNEKINQLINKILHHSQFQRLESSWRGLTMIAAASQRDKNIHIRFLNLTYRELYKDTSSAIEFDQTQIFKKIYTEEYDQPGGQPFGLLIGDYYISQKPSQSIPDPLGVLQTMARIGAASFCPFITGVSAHMFGQDYFSEFSFPFKVHDLFQSQEYQRWKSLRLDFDSRYIGLTLPRVLLRRPYNADGIKAKQRFFSETISEHNDYLWGNACYAFAAVAIQSFSHSGWFADIRGLNPNDNTGGIINLMRDFHHTGEGNLANKPALEFAITDNQEKILSDAGFIAIRDNRHLQKAIFYSCQSINTPKRYTSKAGTINARIAAMLHYILCASRFAHYIKVIIRDKVGGFISPEECQRFLDNWLRQYCATTNNQLSAEARARYPLNDSKVEVKERPGIPGSYYCTMYLKPHYQLEEIQSHLKLVTHLRLAD